MSRSRLEPSFLETPAGRIFVLLRAPREADRCVLFVPPFGEEMNKCRRQVTETAERLVAGGYAALVVDLFGTGDSAGEFSEATWDGWKVNLASAMAWASERDLSIDSLVATRLGCVLAVESLQRAERKLRRAAFWQPVENGRQFITQFLRLRVAASMMTSEGGETVDDLRARLRRGDVVEVAGYPLTGELAEAIEAVELAPALDASLGELRVFEVGRSPAGELSIPVKGLLQSTTGRGIRAIGSRIEGDPFWSATEIVTNPVLAQRTVGFLTGAAE